MRASSSGILPALAAAVIASAAILAAGPVHAEGGHGPTHDSVTGWRCISAFCDTVIQPRTGCLCRKDNPGETVASRVRLTCIGTMPNGQSCTAVTRFRLN